MEEAECVVHLMLGGAVWEAAGSVVDDLHATNPAHVGVAASLGALEVDVVILVGPLHKLDAAIGLLVVVIEHLGDVLGNGGD